MAWTKHDYEKIPGTYVFDGKTSHAAYPLNKLLFSFNHEENRQAFADDPEGYADKFGLSDKQKHALVNFEFLEMLKMGANIYFLAKLVYFFVVNKLIGVRVFNLFVFLIPVFWLNVDAG